MLAFLATVVLAASDPRLLQAEKFVEARDCDGLMDLLGRAKRSEAARDLSYARLLVRGAGACRAQDGVLALGMTEKALFLAPGDYGVATAHAENLLGLDQRAEAEKLLDQTVQDHPEGAVRARFLRGELAAREGESAVCVQVLSPILEDPEFGARAKELAAGCQGALQQKADDRLALAEREREALARAGRANEIAAARGALPQEKGMPRSGSEVWSVRGTVKSGGSRTFQSKNVKAGFTYELRATVLCTRASKTKKKGKLGTDSGPDLFGVDFRAKVGSADAVPLRLGASTPERNAVPFRSTDDNPQIQIEDRSDGKAGVKCTVSDISVRVP
ncbi:MAG: hypothetical protein ACYC8T_09760 [Myxococcaceae bacterium]